MGAESGMGGASTPQGMSPSFGQNMFGANTPPPGTPTPLVPGTPGRNSDPLPTGDPLPNGDPLVAQRPPMGNQNIAQRPMGNPNLTYQPPSNPYQYMGGQGRAAPVGGGMGDPVQRGRPGDVQPMLPPANNGMGGLAQAFMGNQATQGSSLPQIMQAPQSPMPDIAAMLAARRPAVQPVPPPATVNPALPLTRRQQQEQLVAKFRNPDPSRVAARLNSSGREDRQR